MRSYRFALMSLCSRCSRRVLVCVPAALNTMHEPLVNVAFSFSSKASIRWISFFGHMHYLIFFLSSDRNFIRFLGVYAVISFGSSALRSLSVANIFSSYSVADYPLSLYSCNGFQIAFLLTGKRFCYLVKSTYFDITLVFVCYIPCTGPCCVFLL